MSHPQVIRARAYDGAGIAATYLMSTAKLGFLRRCHDAEHMWRHFSIMPAKQETWIIRHKGQIAAFLAIQSDWVDHLYIHPTAQRTGLGSALLRHAKTILPDGFQLWTFQQNAGAQNFYDHHGLTVSLRTDGARNEEQLPDMKYIWRPKGKTR